MSSSPELPAKHFAAWCFSSIDGRPDGLRVGQGDALGTDLNAAIIGVDLAKNVFQLHGASLDGTVIFRKKLTRAQFHRFMADQSTSLVVMEACGGAHYWAWELDALGHRSRLISPHYVKPFVKRQKNDAADAEAIVEAAELVEDMNASLPRPIRDICRDLLDQIAEKTRRIDDAPKQINATSDPTSSSGQCR